LFFYYKPDSYLQWYLPHESNQALVFLYIKQFVYEKDDTNKTMVDLEHSSKENTK
jgi:hypothetical protein